MAATALWPGRSWRPAKRMAARSADPPENAASLFRCTGNAAAQSQATAPVPSNRGAVWRKASGPGENTRTLPRVVGAIITAPRRMASRRAAFSAALLGCVALPAVAENAQPDLDQAVDAIWRVRSVSFHFQSPTSYYY